MCQSSCLIMLTPIFLQVGNTLKALQRLAAKHREQFQVPVVGITGSNGKTVVKEWIYQLLSPEKVITRSPRSYNSQIGVPLSVWMMNEHTELGIFEAGISEMGEIGSITAYHSAYYRSVDKYRLGTSGEFFFFAG